MNSLQQTLFSLVGELLSEGGNAADTLVRTKLLAHPDNAERDLAYSKISDEDLTMLLPEVYGTFPDSDDQTYLGKILYLLGQQNLIDTSSPPRFQIGSTRLAALKRYGSDVISTDEFETADIINLASQKKTDYSDLDVDVVFKAPAKEVANAIEQVDPSVYATKLGKSEIHVAVRVGNRVFQIDLLDVANDRSTKQFLQKSSFVDLASEIKGAFSIILLRATASAMELQQGDAFEAVLGAAEDNPDTEFAKILQKQIKLGWKPIGARFSLGEKGLKFVLDLRKPKRNDPSKMSRKSINIESESRVGFGNLDALAKVILNHSGANGSTIYHASKLADFIGKNKSGAEISLIWDNFVDSAELNLKSGISQQEYDLGMKVLGKSMKKEWHPIVNQEVLSEARSGIGRFSGPNKFNRKTAFDVLRTLVDVSNSEGKVGFDIDLDEDSSIDLVEKMDSMFCHFGLDKRGTFFMESSNSGPVYSKNVDKRFGFNADLLESFKYLQNNVEFQQSLKDISKRAGPFRYDAELFPVLTHKGTSDGNIVFVGTPYAKNKLGSEGAFVLFSCKLWNPDRQSWNTVTLDQNDELTSLLKYESVQSGWGSEWKIYTNNEDMKMGGSLHIELGKTLANYLKDGVSFEKGLGLLSTRKGSPEKKELVSELDRVGQALQSALNNFANKASSNLGGEGSYIEGVVLKINKANGDVYEVKGTSDMFDERKNFFWEDRVKVLNLEKALENHFAKEIIGTKTVQPAALNRAIRAASDAFEPSSGGAQRKVEFLEFLVPYLVEGEVDYAEVKKQAKEAIKSFTSQLKSDKANFKKEAPKLDPDSVRKTQEIFSHTEKKVANLKTAINSGLTDKPFYINLLNAVLGFRVDRIVNFETGVGRDPKDDFRKRVIIWNGRAQPWHIGHDAMIKRGKEALAEVGADAVYIMLVKGATSSKNKAENPLNEREQYDLVASIYEGDSEVIVADKFPKSGFIVDLMEDLHDKGYKVAGWLAGADRIGEYMKTLRSFSPSLYLEDHDYSPIDKDENGDVLVKMIETPRLMSGTQARELAFQEDFEDWYSNIAPKNVPVKAKEQYKIAYDQIRGTEDEPIEESAGSSMQGGSAEGAAGAQGGPWNNREIKKDNEEEKKRSELDTAEALIHKEAMIKEVMDYLLKDTRRLPV
jgi:nicotinamide mononucleotide adenylyltransferase